MQPPARTSGRPSALPPSASSGGGDGQTDREEEPSSAKKKKKMMNDDDKEKVSLENHGSNAISRESTKQKLDGNERLHVE